MDIDRPYNRVNPRSLRPAGRRRGYIEGLLLLSFLSILVVSTGFANSLVLNNQVFNPASHHQAKMAVQWAISAKEIEESNISLKQGIKLKLNALHFLRAAGKNKLDIPKKAEYFRVLMWSKNTIQPDFLTNWVELQSDKTYHLTKKHLIPIVLMTGTGC